MKRISFALITLVCFLLTSCAPKMAAAPSFTDQVMQKDAATSGGLAPEMAIAPASAPMESGNALRSSVPAKPVTTDSSSATDRLVIQNADLSIVLEDPAKGMDSIAMLASDLGGFVVTSNLYKITTQNGQKTPEAQITIRVPAAKLDEALTRIKALVEKKETDVLTEHRTGQDVTKEYTDLKSRLTNLEEAEKQLREILGSATKTEDVLNVFNRLTEIREQIEVIKGQMKYYEESAALSAINLRIQSKASVAPLSIGGWQPVGVARDALQALLNALKFLVNAAIWIVLFVLPVVLIILIPIRIVWVLFRNWRAKRKLSKTPSEISPAEKK